MHICTTKLYVWAGWVHQLAPTSGPPLECRIHQCTFPEVESPPVYIYLYVCVYICIGFSTYEYIYTHGCISMDWMGSPVGLLLEWRTRQCATPGVADPPVHIPWIGEPSAEQPSRIARKTPLWRKHKYVQIPNTWRTWRSDNQHVSRRSNADDPPQNPNRPQSPVSR